MKADFYVQLASSSPVKYSENFWTGYRYWIYENNDGKQERGNTINCKRNARLAFEALKGKPQAYEEALKGAEYAKAEREIVRREDAHTPPPKAPKVEANAAKGGQKSPKPKPAKKPIKNPRLRWAILEGRRRRELKKTYENWRKKNL